MNRFWSETVFLIGIGKWWGNSIRLRNQSATVTTEHKRIASHIATIVFIFHRAFLFFIWIFTLLTTRLSASISVKENIGGLKRRCCNKKQNMHTQYGWQDFHPIKCCYNFLRIVYRKDTIVYGRIHIILVNNC